MFPFDSNGWSEIHTAAFKGFIQTLEKLVKTNSDALELTTNDELRSTPLLLAVMSGNVDTVEALINLGAQIHVRNSQGHGIIEICCLRKDITMLKYFLDSTDDETLPVWVQLIDFIGSRDDEESIRASYAVHQLLTDECTQNKRNHYETRCIGAGLCPMVVKVTKGMQGHECKKQALLAFFQIIRYEVVREQFCDNMGVESLLPLLRTTSTPDLAKITIQIMDVLIMEPNGYSDKVYHSGVISELNKILLFVVTPIEEKENVDSEDDSERQQQMESLRQLKLQWKRHDLLKEIVQFLGDLAEIHESYQSSIGKEPDCLKRISSLFLSIDNRTLLSALTISVAKLAANNRANQNIFMKENVDDSIISLTKVKNQTIQLSAVDAIYALSEGNLDFQSQLIIKNAHKPMLLMLKKSGRNIMINEKTSLALWSLAGDTRESKAQMASYIGVDILIDFLQTSSNILQLIGSESIFVLSGGPLSRRDDIAKNNGTSALVNLLKSNNREIVLSCIRSLRQLCVTIGYIPQQDNQRLVIITRGLQMLVGLMRFCEDELVQVEAAYTIASVTLRNKSALKELHDNPKFNYVYILEKMYSANNYTRLLASAALAAFAYNNLAEQKKIAMCGGIRFKALQPFLFVDDEREKLMSAFQLVVLARVIPDEELAISTACGIKALTETLSKSTNPDIQELGCDCVARLCHTRAGVVNGLISLGVTDVLCDFMRSYNESVRGTAAIALRYLSHHPESRRQIFRRCRKDPYLVTEIENYKSHNSIDPEFVECWTHYERFKLPKIKNQHPIFTTSHDIDLSKDLDVRQITLVDSTSNGSDLGSLSERRILPKLPKIKNKSNESEKSFSAHLDPISMSDNQETTSDVEVHSDTKMVSFHEEETNLSLV